MLVYKTRKDLNGLHLGTDKLSSGWLSIRGWYDRGFDSGGLSYALSIRDALTKKILFDHPLHSWDEKTW